MTRPLRRSAALTAFAVVAAVSLTACGGRPDVASLGVPVTTARVDQRALPYEITAIGTAEPIQTVAVVAQVGGLLSKVAFKEGDDVKQGQLLFQIDPRPYQATLDQALGILARDQAQLANAEADLKRYEALVAKDYVTAQQYEQAKTAAEADRATLAADRANVETARLNLQFAAIRSPINGRTGGLLVKEGNLVKAGGQPLVTINQIHPILVRFSVPVIHLPLLRKYGSAALPVQVRPGGVSATTAPAHGTLSFVDNAVDTLTGTILLKAQFQNEDGALWPGELVNVVLDLFTQPNALVVPSQAVVQGQQGTFVFVVKSDNTAEVRPVLVSRVVGDLSLIDQGLSAGEVVVTDGQLRLTAGAKVQVKGASDAESSASAKE
jgi:multidrug efflux system membrane fusion protein